MLVLEKKMINMSLEDYQFIRILMKLPKKKYVGNGKLRYVKNSNLYMKMEKGNRQQNL